MYALALPGVNKTTGFGWAHTYLCYIFRFPEVLHLALGSVGNGKGSKQVPDLVLPLSSQLTMGSQVFPSVKGTVRLECGFRS